MANQSAELRLLGLTALDRQLSRPDQCRDRRMELIRKAIVRSLQVPSHPADELRLATFLSARLAVQMHGSDKIADTMIPLLLPLVELATVRMDVRYHSCVAMALMVALRRHRSPAFDRGTMIQMDAILKLYRSSHDEVAYAEYRFYALGAWSLMLSRITRPLAQNFLLGEAPNMPDMEGMLRVVRTGGQLERGFAAIAIGLIYELARKKNPYCLREWLPDVIEAVQPFALVGSTEKLVVDYLARRDQPIFRLLLDDGGHRELRNFAEHHLCAALALLYGDTMKMHLARHSFCKTFFKVRGD